MAGLESSPGHRQSDNGLAGTPILSVEADEATNIFDCLSSATAREIMAALHEEPRTGSDLAALADTSIQNVRYHLDKFEDSNLVAIVDTEVSTRGQEMDVYAPTHDALVLYAGEDRTSNHSLTELLRATLGAVGFLGVLSLLIEVLLPVFLRGMVPGDAAVGLADRVFIHISGVSVSAGLVFFGGGVLVLGVVFGGLLLKADRSAPANYSTPP